MISNSSFKKRKYDDNDDDDDSDVMNDGKEKDNTISNRNVDMIREDKKVELENKEVERDETKVENKVENSDSSVDMTKILEEIRLIEQGMLFDSIDPVAKRYIRKQHLIKLN